MAAVEQQELGGLRLVATVDLNRVSFGKAQIISLWEDGILANLAYVYMAMQHEKQFGNPRQDDGYASIDIEDFIERWCGTPDPETGKSKYLKREQIVQAIAKLQAVEALETPMFEQLKFSI